ncbi:MAG: T9SS type A sorting domain-containing protein [Saprospiraceae bacterium]
MKIKTYVLLPFSLLILASISAQTPASAILNVNNVKVQVNANGALFTDFTDGQFIAPYEPGQPEISTMRASGIWLGGFDPAGNIKGAIHAYNENGKADFQPGILDDVTGTATGQLTQIYRVTKADIEEHLADFHDNFVIDNPNPNVFGWPAVYNPYFSQYHNGETLPATSQGLADFWDENSDGVYNPTHGDFPIIGVRGCDEAPPHYADEMLWFVFNDEMLHTQSLLLPIRMEVQCQIFAFNCQEAPLGNTIFARYKMINRAGEDLDSAYVGVFADFDIGNPNDDFIGSDSLRSIVFGYNGDDNDEAGYGNHAPAMAIDLIRGPLDEDRNELPLTHVMPIEGALPTTLTNPNGPYNLLAGHYEDGTSAPNNGYFYNGDPNDPSAWTEVTEGNTPGDRKVVGSYGPFKLQPGAVNELILAYSFHQEPDNSNLENVTTMYKQTDQVQALFDNCFDIATAIACTPNVTGIFEVEAENLSIYPNPATDAITIELPETLQGPIALTDLTGRQLLSVDYPIGSKSTQLNVSGFPQGMYVIVAKGKDGTIFRQKVILSDF